MHNHAVKPAAAAAVFTNQLVTAAAAAYSTAAFHPQVLFSKESRKTPGDMADRERGPSGRGGE